MFKLKENKYLFIFFLAIILLYPLLIYSATTSGDILTDEVWSGEVLVTGDVWLKPGVTLSIEPGVVVKFSDNSDDQIGGYILTGRS